MRIVATAAIGPTLAPLVWIVPVWVALFRRRWRAGSIRGRRNRLAASTTSNRLAASTTGNRQPQLSDVDRDAIAALRTRWRELMLAAGPVDRTLAERLLHEHHALFGFAQVPRVEWCAGPLELSQRVLAWKKRTGEPANSPLPVWNGMWAQLQRQMPEWYGRELFWSFNDRVMQEIWGALFFDVVRAELGDSRWQMLANQIWSEGYVPGHLVNAGQGLKLGWRFSWCPFWQYLDEHEGRSETQTLRPLLSFAAAVPWWAMTTGTAFLCERPIASRIDEQGRPHDAEAAALRFADGVTLHAWHGTVVPASLIEQPATFERIESTPNAEFRRVLLERYGLHRYLRERGAEPIAEDEYGRLWRLDANVIVGPHGFQLRWEPMVVLEVENATIEPDGSRRRYTLQVPPGTQTPRQAVAWTFGLEEDAYLPTQQT